MRPSSLMRENIRSLTRPSYATLPPDVVRMNDNANLFAPNPVLSDAVREFDFESLSRYPSVASDELVSAVKEKLALAASDVMVGNGSDELIDLAVRTFVDPGDRVAVAVPSFEMYGMYARIAGARLMECRLRRSGFQLDVDAILSCDPKMVFLGSPNNPTGNSFDRHDVCRVAQESDSIVIVDEAYVQFSDSRGLLELVERGENVLLLRTFSKAYSLAGLRVGFGIASSELVAAMRKACAPFRLNMFSEWVATRALENDEFVVEMAKLAAQEKGYVSGELERLGAEVYPSETNFLLFRSPIPVSDLLAGLLRRGIAIRDCSTQPLLGNCARVTLGRRELNERFLASVKAVLEESG